MTTPGTGTWRFYDVDADANFYPTLDSISIVNQQPCQLAVFTGTIKGTTNPLAKEHEVIAYYTPTGGSEGKMFGGDISVYTLAHVEPGGDIPVYSFSARDYTARLDDTIITDGLRPAETLNSRLAWLVAYTPMFEVTDGTSSITADLAAYDYTSLSKREALQHMAGLVGAVFYVNFDKALKFYSADATIAADFGLATPASPPTSYEYRNFTLDEDTTDRADDIFVEGTDISTWRPSDTPSGGKQRALVDTNIADLGTAQQAGDIELARIGTAQISGALEMFQPGLESGQTVHIVNPTHSLDDDYIISSTSISCISTNDEALTIIGVQFADRLLCRPQPDFSRDNSATDGNGGGDTGTCGRATALLTDGVDADLWLESGGGEQIFVGDGDKVAKYKLDLGTKIWEVSETGSVPYGSHQPGTYVPINFGDKAYRRDNGVERWSLAISAIAAQVQDRKKFWVTSGTGGSALPELGYGDFSVDFGPVASPVIVWRGYVTSVPSSGYPLDVTVTGGGRHQVYCGATTNFPYNGVSYGMIMITDASWTDSGTPPTEADVAALWDPATDPHLVGPTALDGDGGEDGGKHSQQAGTAVDADDVETTLAGEPALEEVGEETLPFDGALARCQAEVDHLFLAVGTDAEGDQNRSPDGAGAGLAGEHDAVEHQGRILVLERPPVEGGDRLIEGLGHRADGRGADLASEQGKQRLADLPGGQAEHEAGEDDVVDLGLAAGIGADHPGRAEAAGARHTKLDVAEHGQEMALVVAIAPVGGLLAVELIEIAVDRRRHLGLDQPRHRPTAKLTVAFAPLQSVGTHRLHELERHR